VQLAAHIGPDPELGGVNVTFIRIAMSGMAPPPHPKFELTAANTGTGTEGTAQVIDPALNVDLISAKALHDGTNPTDAASAWFVPPYTDNVYLLKVAISIPGTVVKTIRITNQTGRPRDFVWVVADSDAESKQPWIHVTPPSLFYNVLINQPANLTSQSANVANKGTGPLTVGGTTPALPAGFTTSALPVTVAPNASAPVPIAFGPQAAAGTVAPASVAFNGDLAAGGAGHNASVSLSAKAQALELTLLLDASGSMSWEPDGDPIPPAPGPSRWNSLASAANEFLLLLASFGDGRGRFGIARFPRTDPGNPSTHNITAPKPISMNMAPDQAKITNVVPAGGTPMGDGLDFVLTPGSGYFSNDPAAVDLNRRWILLMTDGAHNEGTHHPNEYLSPANGGTAPAGTSLSERKIKVFSIGYGVEGKADVDYNLIKKISQGSFEGGDTVQVESSGKSAPQLAAAFRNSIKAGLISVSSPTDPGHTLTKSHPEARHQVIITPYDTKVVFVVNWDKEDAQRVRLHLMTPTCDLLTPESAPGPFGAGDVGFSGASRYQLYRVEDGYLRNAADPARPRYGTWTMVVFSDEVRAGESGSEYYEYDVIVESSLRMEVALDRAAYYAGDTVGVSATLTVNGKPIKHAGVSLRVTVPAQSFDNWLAKARVSPQEFSVAQTKVEEFTNDANPLYVKAFAAEAKGLTYTKLTGDVTIPLTDPDEDGVYTGSFEQTTTPGSYKLYVTAVGTTEDGVVFRRERSLELSVGVRPLPAYTLVDVLYNSVPATAGVLTATVNVTPLDAYGNVLLLDPATPGGIDLTAKGGRVDPLTTTYDGTYTTTLSYPPGTRPLISLSVGGTTVISDQPVAAVDRLQYVDRVIDFKPGLEGAPGANRHADPAQALGDIGPKPPGRFLSLGGYGSLTVAVGGQDILAQGDDDFTVFVHRDSDPRPYRVEAAPAGTPGAWVEVGTSAGVTQSFSLSSASLAAASAIRITDTSGRTRGADLKPVETPGVSIRGVGVARVGRAPVTDSSGYTPPKDGCLGGWLGALVRWVTSLFRKQDNP
jgi:hypothetical protein